MPLLLHEHLLLTVPVESCRKRSKPLQSKGFDLSVIFFASLLTRRDDLGRVVIPKEIRRTMRIREGDPLLTPLTPFDKFCVAIHSVVERYKETAE